MFIAAKLKHFYVLSLELFEQRVKYFLLRICTVLRYPPLGKMKYELKH